MHLITRLAKTLGSRPLVVGGMDRVELTAAGMDYLPRAKTLLDAFEAFSSARPEIRVSGYPIHAAIVAPYLASFVESHEDVSIVLHEISDESRRDRGSRLLRHLSEGRIDLVVAPTSQTDEFRSLEALRLVIACRRSRRRRGQVRSEHNYPGLGRP